MRKQRKSSEAYQRQKEKPRWKHKVELEWWSLGQGGTLDPGTSAYGNALDRDKKTFAWTFLQHIQMQGQEDRRLFFLETFFFRLRRRDSNNVEDPEILGGVLKPLLYEAERHLGLRETAVLWFASKCPMCSQIRIRGPQWAEMCGKDQRCGLVRGDVPLGVGFEVSRAHAVLVGIPLLSLPGARDQDGSPQLLSQHHICLPTAVLPATMVVDSLSGTMSLYKPFPLVMVSHHSSCELTKTSRIVKNSVRLLTRKGDAH